MMIEEVLDDWSLQYPKWVNLYLQSLVHSSSLKQILHAVQTLKWGPGMLFLFKKKKISILDAESTGIAALL